MGISRNTFDKEREDYISRVMEKYLSLYRKTLLDNIMKFHQ